MRAGSVMAITLGGLRLESVTGAACGSPTPKAQINLTVARPTDAG